MEIKLSRLKQIISEVVEERHASERMDDIMQSTREEEVDPHDQALDEMIAEEVEAAMEQFVLDEAEDKVDSKQEECDKKNSAVEAQYAVHGYTPKTQAASEKYQEECPDHKPTRVHEGTESESE